MPSILQLEEFGLTEFRCLWHEQKPRPEKQNLVVKVTPRIHLKVPTKDEFVLQLEVEIGPDPEGPRFGYEIKSVAVGRFRFPDEGVDVEKNQRALVVNGAYILYGILRGELSTMLGAFVGPKLYLPTINMAAAIQTAPVPSEPESEKKQQTGRKGKQRKTRAKTTRKA